MQVSVDKLVCEANQTCERIAPEVFRLDDEDELEILQPTPPEDLHDKVREAVSKCPKQALALTHV